MVWVGYIISGYGACQGWHVQWDICCFYCLLGNCFCVVLHPMMSVVCREQPKASPARSDGDTHQADSAVRGPILKTPVTSIPQSQTAVGGK